MFYDRSTHGWSNPMRLPSEPCVVAGLHGSVSHEKYKKNSTHIGPVHMSPAWWEAHLSGMNYFCVHMTVFIPPKGLIPRVFFVCEMRKFSREIIVRMRDEDK